MRDVNIVKRLIKARLGMIVKLAYIAMAYMFPVCRGSSLRSVCKSRFIPVRAVGIRGPGSLHARSEIALEANNFHLTKTTHQPPALSAQILISTRHISPI